MTTRPLIALALAMSFATTYAVAADVRMTSPSFRIGPRGVTSMQSAGTAAPLNRAGATDANFVRSNIDREARQNAMLQKLIKERRVAMGAAALAATAPLALPHVPGSPIPDSGNAFGFKGLSNLDQANVNQGFSVEPPDQALCVGNGFIFEGVNDAFAIYTENGGLIAGPVQANAFFGVPFELNVE